MTLRLITATSLLAALAFASAARSDIIAFSSFDGSDDGWKAADLSIPPNANPPTVKQPLPIQYHFSGGDPTGYVQGFFQDTSWWCFVAPSAFLGNRSAAYGGFIQFDRRSMLGDFGPRPGVFLVGGGMTLSYVTDPPATTWSYVTAPLVPAGWRVDNWASGPAPTEAQMRAVLGALEHIYITGQWEIEDTSKMDLDNVQLAGPSTGDLDVDGAVGESDLGLMLGQWGRCVRPCAGDLDGNGIVDGADLGALLAAWGESALVGCPASNHSCYAAGTPGCTDLTCCAFVCANDAHCCTVAWDATCVKLATEQCAGCGNPQAGACCSAHESAFCSEQACCEAVCATDSFCCQVQWDGGCASAASVLSACTCQ